MGGFRRNSIATSPEKTGKVLVVFSNRFTRDGKELVLTQPVGDVVLTILEKSFDLWVECCEKLSQAARQGFSSGGYTSFL